jgi:hypothetical protein
LTSLLRFAIRTESVFSTNSICTPSAIGAQPGSEFRGPPEARRANDRFLLVLRVRRMVAAKLRFRHQQRSRAHPGERLRKPDISNPTTTVTKNKRPPAAGKPL